MNVLSRSNYPEDLTQDTVLRILEFSGNIPEDDFLPWAKRVMKNVFYNTTRYENLRETSDIPEDYDVELYSEDSIEYKSLVKFINLTLSDPQRDCFWLWYEGFSYEEISKKLGIPEGTVKSRISTGRKKLKEALKILYMNIK